MLLYYRGRIILSSGTRRAGSRKKDRHHTNTISNTNSPMITAQSGNRYKPKNHNIAISNNKMAGKIATCGIPYFVNGILIRQQHTDLTDDWQDTCSTSFQRRCMLKVHRELSKKAGRSHPILRLNHQAFRFFAPWKKTAKTHRCIVVYIPNEGGRQYTRTIRRIVED